MKTFNDEEVSRALSYNKLIENLEAIAVDEKAYAPERYVIPIITNTDNDGALLTKPGYITNEIIGVKVVTYFPDNGNIAMPTIQAGYMLFSAINGSLIGACEANTLTTKRTAAASAAIAKRLAREDSKHLLIIGTGALSPMAATAHAFVRKYETIEIWGRDASKAQLVVDTLLANEDLKDVKTIQVCTDLDDSVSKSDVICCCTGSKSPVLKGAQLKRGCFIDLIGSFTPEMRESDDDVIKRCDLIFIDTYDALKSGDIYQPLQSNLITNENIQGNYKDIIAGKHIGRSNNDEIIMFKSAGFALQDLAAAKILFDC